MNEIQSKQNYDSHNNNSSNSRTPPMYITNYYLDLILILVQDKDKD